MGLVVANHLERRSDTSDTCVSSACTRHSENLTTHVVTDYDPVQNYTGINYGSYVGYRIPNFFARRRRGELLPQTPWTRYEISGSASGMYDITYTSSGVDTHQWYTGPYTVNTPYYGDFVTEEELYAAAPTLTDKYVQEAAAAIYSTGFDALTWLAELAEVHRMFINVARRLATLRIPRFFRGHRSFKDIAKRVFKGARNEYMEFRYGWRMLLYDMDNISELITSWNEKVQRYSEHKGNHYSYVSNPVTTYENSYLRMERQYHIEVSIGLRGSVIAEIDVPKIQFNPLQTAWELIPLSFVVDWFVSVGKSISALSFLAHQSKYCASKGYIVEISKDVTHSPYETKSGYVSGTTTRHFTSTGVLKVRTPCNVPLIPHTALHLNSFKVLDLLAIITQRLK